MVFLFIRKANKNVPFSFHNKRSSLTVINAFMSTQAEAQSQKQQEQLDRLRKDMGAVPMETAAPTGTFIQNGHVSFIKGVI